MTRRPALVLGFVLVALASAPAAEASCVQPPPVSQSVAEADVAFVGTVVALDHDGRTATFRVEDVWKGAVPETVVVHGGPGIATIEEAARQGRGVATSVDRTYTAGTRYLMLPSGKAKGVFLDNSCTNTQPYTAGLADLRPAGAHPPDIDAAASNGAPAPADGSRNGWAWLLLVALAVAGAGLAASLAWLMLRVRARALP
jgi:hypothetical protein